MPKAKNPTATPPASLGGYDNDSYMVAWCEGRLDDVDDVPDNVFCPACGWKTKWQFTRLSFKIRRKAKKRDISVTYDLATIVSQRFRDIAIALGETASIFVPLPAEPGFFHLVPRRIVAFDVKKRQTEQEDLCPHCGLYAQTAGAVPAYLAEPFPKRGHIFRTDILFGSYNERTPLPLISGKLHAALREAKLSGLNLHAITPGHMPNPAQAAS
jgi:hypothetical protein